VRFASSWHSAQTDCSIVTQQAIVLTFVTSNRSDLRLAFDQGILYPHRGIKARPMIPPRCLLVLAFLLTVWLPSPSQADTPTISASDAWMYVGKNVSVEDVVTAVSTSKKGNTFINFGGVYPNQTFTGWVRLCLGTFVRIAKGEENQDHWNNPGLSREARNQDSFEKSGY
jgi:hypothetical protein